MNAKNDVCKDYGETVYWVESNGTGWKLEHGVLLGHYSILTATVYIVTLGEVTSCVVRHLQKYYLSEKEAWASLAEVVK